MINCCLRLHFTINSELFIICVERCMSGESTECKLWNLRGSFNKWIMCTDLKCGVKPFVDRFVYHIIFFVICWKDSFQSCFVYSHKQLIDNILLMIRKQQLIIEIRFDSCLTFGSRFFDIYKHVQTECWYQTKLRLIVAFIQCPVSLDHQNFVLWISVQLSA